MSFLGSLGSAIAGGLAGFVTAGPWGAVAGAAGGLLSGIGSDSDSSDSYEQKLALQNEQLQYQMQENQKDRDFNSNQAQLNREFQTSEREATQDWNKASAQVQRLQDAGLNASAILGGSGAGSAAGVSSPMQGAQAQANSSALPAYPIETPYETLLKAQSTQGAYLKALSGAYKDMSDAGVNDAKKDQLWASAANLITESRLNELKQEAQDLANQIVKLTGREKAASEIGVLVAQAELLMQQKETEVQKGNLTSEQVTTEVYNGLLARLRGVLTEKEIEKALIDLKFWERGWSERLDNLVSSTSSNYASAEQSRAIARTEDEVRTAKREMYESISDLNRAQRQGQKLDNWLKDKTNSAKAYDALQKAYQSRIITESERVKLERAIWENDVKTIDKFFSWLNSAAAAYRDVGIGNSSNSNATVNGVRVLSFLE